MAPSSESERQTKNECGISFGSLFTGIGGLDLGFEREGFQCKWQVEIDEYAQAVLAKHWPDIPRRSDVKECNAENLKKADGIVFGFPCQDISVAGNGAGIHGERSGLLFEALRVVAELRPKFIVMENVAALLSRGLGELLREVAAIGFDAEWHCLPAAYVGAPHIRDRIFVLAYAERTREGREADKREPVSFGKGCAGVEARRDETGVYSYTEGNGREQGQQNIRGGDQRSEAGEKLRFRCGGQNASNADSPRLEKREGLAGEWAYPAITRSDWWAVEPAVGRVADGIPRRVDRLRGLGNAVVPQVAQIIARIVKDRLESKGLTENV